VWRMHSPHPYLALAWVSPCALSHVTETGSPPPPQPPTTKHTCRYLVTNKHVGDSLTLDVLRAGEELSVQARALPPACPAHFLRRRSAALPGILLCTISLLVHHGIPLSSSRCPLQVQLRSYQYLVPPHLRESKPSYFIVGGLVFTPCTGGPLPAHQSSDACARQLPCRGPDRDSAVARSSPTWPPPRSASSPRTDPYLLQRYGSLGGAPVRLMSKTYYGVKSQSDEQVGGWRAGW
jgi:hypothetical protein